MKSLYPVLWNQEEVGEVGVTKQGLYYVFSCRMQLPPGSRCRLYACSQGDSRDLGLCIPEGNFFVLQTRIPAKYFPEEEYSFCLNQPATGRFVPVRKDRPFPELDKLESGKFSISGGEPGIFFSATEQLSDSP